MLLIEEFTPNILGSVLAVPGQAAQVSGEARSRLRSYKLQLFQNASSCRPSASPMTWADGFDNGMNSSIEELGGTRLQAGKHRFTDKI